MDRQWAGGLGVRRVCRGCERWCHGDDHFEVDATQLGGNIGFGLMAFGDPWGLRTDVRYFTGFADEGDIDPIDVLDPADFLGDVDYWGANVGVAYRW